MLLQVAPVGDVIFCPQMHRHLQE